MLGSLVWPSSRAAFLLQRIAVSLAFLLGVATLKVPIESLAAPNVYRKDFLQEYLLACAIAEGVNPYLPIRDLAERFLGSVPVPVFPHPTPHPPTAGLIFLPLAFLDYPSAAILWTLFELACLLATAYLLGRIGGVRFGIGHTLVVAVISLVWYPFLLDLTVGQLMLPILLLLAGGQYALLSGRRSIGGSLLGLSLLIKPIAWPLLLVFVVRRDWRPLSAAVLAVLVGYGTAACTIGIDEVFAYLTRVLPEVTYLYRADPSNVSAWTIGWRLFDGTRSEILTGIIAPPLYSSAPAAGVVSVMLPAIILLASMIVVRSQRSESRSLGLMICVSILVSPISWSHYLLLTAIPVVEVVVWLTRHQMLPRETNLALLVALLLIPKDERKGLALALTDQTAAPDGTALIPFAPALLTLGPTIAVAALAMLLVALRDIRT